MAAASSDRKSTRLNSSHLRISYAVFCLKKKNDHTSSSEQLEKLRLTPPYSLGFVVYASTLLRECDVVPACVVCRLLLISFFFFNDTATTEIYTLSLHDALPILGRRAALAAGARRGVRRGEHVDHPARSEEHTSELQSPQNLVCRLLLEKKV